jgi:hypothetical protein
MHFSSCVDSSSFSDVVLSQETIGLYHRMRYDKMIVRGEGYDEYEGSVFKLSLDSCLARGSAVG